MEKEILNHSDKMLQNDWEKEFNYAGSFQTGLMQLIQMADHINLKKLEIIYPNIVKAYKEYMQ